MPTNEMCQNRKKLLTSSRLYLVGEGDRQTDGDHRTVYLVQSCAPGVNTGHFGKAEKEKVSQNCQIYPEEKEQSRRHNFPILQTTLQSYSNQNSVVLMQKQTYESMEQNEEPRNKPTHLQLINLLQKRQKYTVRKKSLHQGSLGKLDSCM